MSGGVSMQEYLLQGSVLDSSCETLLHRLRGLSDNVEAGPEAFVDQEQVYILRGSQTPPVLLRARRALDQPDSLPCQLRYVGTAEAGIGDKSRSTLVRTCIDVATSDNVTTFLTDMGFRLDHECVVKGFLFTKGCIKVTVSKIFRLTVPGNTENLEPLSLSHLVELSVVSPSGQDEVADTMKLFAEQLKPIVQLEKVDHRRLQQV
ncbi:PREDICTED: mediator of RNA polymerase II transcription subunit 18-like isoform X3 [Branchiostoma belcheri]|uniref:Mediator of RNA polymerase II transcription subunit 18 n=1 Tax=Branchiostoma belcheri TaxID=7741 RepID=A0A6P4XED8_BRABE|nr:PREDICTED: mediator of RNA polymerase II transcription subunit 18-like isoform X1 [Branchiostoma belcheri]XP_019614917.1 PREDICTED: mediator of RNA polymerase II transcription subunit 18-like isoform X3 [Branchiostoma belcheri]